MAHHNTRKGNSYKNLTDRYNLFPLVKTMKSLLPKLTSITIFSIAMAFLETSVVIYLRELLYPGGFNFPLVPIPDHLLLTEVLREFATIIMLIGAGVLAGKTFSQKFAWFIYAFAIWDIFYYVFLKLLINWPESLMTWDILFLIPTTWTGPVISPVIVSLTMIAFAILILFLAEKGLQTRISGIEWGILIVGSVVLIVGFTWDYLQFVIERMGRDGACPVSAAISYIPKKFPWGIFILGEIIIVWGVIIYFRRVKNGRL
jgi:hypothetical protein